jgi:hypothetical protein
MAFWLVAKAAELLPIKIRTPRNIGNRRIIALPSWPRDVKGKGFVPYPTMSPYTLFLLKTLEKSSEGTGRQKLQMAGGS